MKLADFPLLLSAFENFVNWRGESQEVHGARRIKSLQFVIASLNQGLEDGEIANVTFAAAKQAARNIFEDGYKSFVENTPALQALKDRPYGEAVRELLDGSYGSYPEPHTLAGKIKKIAKLPQNDRAVIIGTAFFKEILPIAEAIQFLKDKTVKRKPLTDEERRARKFEAPRSTSKAVDRVRGLLETIVEDEYQHLLAIFTNRYNALLDGFLVEQAKADKDPSLKGFRYGHKPREGQSPVYAEYYSPRWHCTYKGEGQFQGMVDHQDLSILENVLKGGYKDDKSYGEYRYTLRPNARDLIVAKATADADEIRAMFIVKNLRKIVSILEAKGDENFGDAKIVGHSVSLNGLEGEIRFTFKDGSSFNVNNTVEFVINSHATRFFRFPLRFNTVVLAGGAKMPSPSEKRMNTVFLGKEA